MSPEANKDVICAYVETIFNHQQLERAQEFVTADYLNHAALPGQAPGLEGAKGKWVSWPASPMCASPSRMGIPPTGKQVHIGGISILRLADGKIAVQWEQLDRLALLQQLSLLPTPG